jgi:hypothetical protein
MSISVDRVMGRMMGGLLQLGVAAVIAMAVCGLGLGLLLWAHDGFAPGAGAIFANSFNHALMGLFSQVYTVSTMIQYLAMISPSSWPDAIPSGSTFVALAPIVAVLLPRHLRLLGATGGFLSLTIMGIYLIRMNAL